MVIKPTVGRIVWFWRSYQPDVVDDAQPMAAIVAYVHSDIMVNLSVIDHNGHHFSKTSVRLQQEGSDPPAFNEMYCEWMPYQIGQAKKHAEDPK